MHKNRLPKQPGQFQRWGAEIAHKCKNLVSASPLNPTKILKVGSVNGNDDITIVMSNLSNRNQPPQQPPPPVDVANTIYRTQRPSHINAITIAPTHTLADTGATSIFVMDGVDVVNRRVATNLSP
jgi:hypothetical protein